MSKQTKPIIKICEGIQTRSSKIINELKGKCSGTHLQCVNIAKRFNMNIEDPELSQEAFVAYLQYINIGNYNSCTSTYNKEYNSRKIECLCGSVIRYDKKYTHVKSFKHINFLNNVINS